MAKAFGYQTQTGGPFAFTNVSDADCDAQYASVVSTGALTNGLPVVSAIEWPTATLNATKTAVTASSGTPLFYATFNPPAPHPAPFEIIRPIVLANDSNDNIPVDGASFLEISGPDDVFTITGFVAGYDGQKLTIKNTTTQILTIAHNDTRDSATANVIFTATGADIVMGASAGTAMFVYSVIDAAWLLIYPVKSA